ncbi:hypothetical protein RDABS01_035986, partial [Bienertia sinuspersici]
PTPS